MSITKVSHFVLLAITALFLASLLFASDNVRDGAAADAKPTPTPKRTKPPKDDPDKELDDILNEDKNNPSKPNTKPGTKPSDEIGDIDDLDEELESDAKPSPTPKRTKPPKDDPDKELDDILNEDKNNPAKPNTKPGTKPADELGDIDDLDDELEDKPKPPTVKDPKPRVKPPKDETPTDEVPDDIKKNTGQVKVARYAVYVITNASGGLFVGSEDDIKGKMSCDFTGGGPRGCKAPPATYMRLSDARLTLDLAQQDLCKGISETRIFPLGIGMKGKWTDDKWYGLWDASVSGCKKEATTQ